MTKTYNIPNEHVAELIEVYGQNYQEDIDDGNGNTIPNPQTKAQFASEIFDKEIINSVKRRVQDYRRTKLMIDINNTEIITL